MNDDQKLQFVAEYLHNLYLSGIKVMNLTTEDDEVLHVVMSLELPDGAEEIIDPTKLPEKD